MDTNIQLRNQVEKYVKRWKWFLLGLALCLFTGYAILQLVTPKYKVTSSIQIKDDKKGDLISELSFMKDVNVLNNVTNNIDNEIEVLKSKSLLENIIKEQQLHIQYFEKHRALGVFPVLKERYVDPPVRISFLEKDSTTTEQVFDETINEQIEFSITIISSSNFRVSETGKTYQFGETITVQNKELILTPNFKGGKFTKAETLLVRISPVALVVDMYSKRIAIAPVSKNASVLQIELLDEVKEKGEHIINELVNAYNNDGIADKSLIAENTSKFIEQRLEKISGELLEVDITAQDFKKSNKLTNIATEASVFLQSEKENDIKAVNATTQLQLVEYMDEYLGANSSSSDLIPANLGFADPSISSISAKHNELVLERNRILKSSSEKNPVIVNLDDQIGRLKDNLNQSLGNLKSSLEITLGEINKQDQLISSRIYSAPRKERELRDIQRQQQIKEALYLYLLQKREEVAVSFGVAVPNAKVIDKAYSSVKPVSPKPSIVYLASLLLGFLIPFGIIYVKDSLDTKIHSIEDLQGNLDIPVLGTLPIFKSKKNLVASTDHSPSAEAFRMLRTNIKFMLAKLNNNGNVIFVTSTADKEGKSYVSSNLAASMAFSGKKVLLVELDIRAPKLVKYLNTQGKKGVTNYISDDKLSLKELIVDVPQVENLSLLSAGDIPPNPAELLQHERLEMLFEKVKEKYDYVVVDTAGVGLVTDTLLISHFSDLSIYVIKANHLDKRMLTIPETIYREERLPNMAMLLNNCKEKGAYNYGYGYGKHYDESMDWRKIFKKSS